MDFCDLIQTPKIDTVILHRQLKQPIQGTLCLTFSHIIVSARKESDFEGNSKEDNNEIWVRFFY